MKRWRHGLLVILTLIWTLRSRLTSGQEAVSFNEVPKDIPASKSGLKSPGEPLITNDQTGLESLFAPATVEIKKPWSGIVATTNIPPQAPAEWDLVPGEGEEPSTAKPKVEPPIGGSKIEEFSNTRSQIGHASSAEPKINPTTPEPKLQPSNDRSIIEGQNGRSNSDHQPSQLKIDQPSTERPKFENTPAPVTQKISTSASIKSDPNPLITPEVFIPPPFEDFPMKGHEISSSRITIKPDSIATKPPINIAHVLKSAIIQPKSDLSTPLPIQIGSKSANPAIQNPVPIGSVTSRPISATHIPAVTVSQPGPTGKIASKIPAVALRPILASTIPHSDAVTVGNAEPSSTSDEDYQPGPDVFPFTVSADELNGGKTIEFIPVHTIETPRPLQETFDRSSAFFNSQWGQWSNWSPCVNNERARVRACSTFVGFGCAGKNKETQFCSVTTTPEPTPPTTLPGFRPADPSNPFGEQVPIDHAAEFGELPGGRKVFVLKQPPGFGEPPPAAPPPEPVDYSDYGLTQEDLRPPAPAQQSSPKQRPPSAGVQVQSQAKFQQKAEEIDSDNSDQSTPKSTSKRPQSTQKSTTQKSIATTAEKSKAKVKFHSAQGDAKAGKFGGSISAPASMNSMNIRPHQGTKVQSFQGSGKRPLVRVAKPKDEETTAPAETTEATTEASTEASSTESTTRSTTSRQNGNGATVTESPPFGGNGKPPKVKPSGYAPGQNGGEDFGIDDIDAPYSNAGQPPNPYGGGQSSYAQPPSPQKPLIPTGFDQATWGNWGPWGPCTCAKRARTRSCDYSTAYLTEGCDGNSYELQPCSGAPCGVQTGCGPSGCGNSGGGYGSSGSSCAGGNCVLQGGQPTGGCAGGACGPQLGGGPVLVQPPFPYPPVPPGSGCPGGQCALQGGPSGGCAGPTCGSPSGYPIPGPPPAPAGYGQSGCTGGGCSLQGGPNAGCTGSSCGSSIGGYPQPAPPPAYGSSDCSGGGCALQGGPGLGCAGGSCNQAPILPPTVGGGNYASAGTGCSGSACGQPANAYPAPAPSPPSGYDSNSGCSGGGCVLNGGSGPIAIQPPAISGGSGYGSNGCSGGGCNLQGGAGNGTGCGSSDCVLTGSGGPIMIKPGGSSGYSAGGGPTSGCGGPSCGSPGGYPVPGPPPAPAGYGQSGCSDGGCSLQGGPDVGCSGSSCGSSVGDYPQPASAQPSSYGSSDCSGGGCALQGGPPSGCGSGGCGGPILPPIVNAPAPEQAGYGSQSGCNGGGCGAPAPSGCGGGSSYGSPECQTPPSAVGEQYKTLPPIENIRMDGVVQPEAFTAPPGVVATHAPAYGAPAYGAPAPGPSYGGRLRDENAPDRKQRAESLVEKDSIEDEDKGTLDRHRKRRRRTLQR